jgi:hypothetical protein
MPNQLSLEALESWLCARDTLGVRLCLGRVRILPPTPSVGVRFGTPIYG